MCQSCDCINTFSLMKTEGNARILETTVKQLVLEFGLLPNLTSSFRRPPFLFVQHPTNTCSCWPPHALNET